MHSFHTLSVEYKSCHVDQRALYSLTPDEIEKLYRLANKDGELEELVVLCTCNRLEFYYLSCTDESEYLWALLCRVKGVRHLESQGAVIRVLTFKEALLHVMKVINGMLSQIPGDLQVISQIKQAFEFSRIFGPNHFLRAEVLTKLLRSHKIVRQQTALFDGAASITYATRMMISSFPLNKSAPIAIVGLGKTGNDLVKTIYKAGYHNLTLVNRTQEVSEKMAKAFDLKCVPYEDRHDLFRDNKVIITAIAKRDLVFKKEDLMTLNLMDYRYVIDLGVPRNVDSELERIPGVLLYGIEDIEEINADALAKRKKELELAHELIKNLVSLKQELTF